jgi:hypothetical protein
MNNKNVIIQRARAYEVHAYCQYSHLSWQGIVFNISPATPIKSRDIPINLLRVAPISLEGSSYQLDLGEDSLLFSITSGALPSYVHHILSTLTSYFAIRNYLQYRGAYVTCPHKLTFRWTRRLGCIFRNIHF